MITGLWSLDFETTGPDPLTARPVGYGLAYRSLAMNNAEPKIELEGFCNPGEPIPAEASDVHGITDEDVADEPDPAEAIAAICQRLESAGTFGEALVIYNARYDWRLLGEECKRYGLVRPAVDIIDPMVIDGHVDRYRKGKRTLTAVAAHYEVALTKAHGAVADALAALDIATRMIHRGLVPANLDEQAGYYRARRDSLVAYFRREGKPITGDLESSTWPE